MKDQILIIGLGQFGMALTRTLSEKGFQVIAVDKIQKLVDEASNFATDAICLNSTDEVALSKLSPKDRDVIICTIGSRESSILTVALLKQMGCKNLIARFTDHVHARILKAIGATHIINPEYEYGKKFANKILLRSMFFDSITEGLKLFEIPVQSYTFDKEQIELKLTDNLKVITSEEDNKIYLKGSKEDIEKMLEENK